METINTVENRDTVGIIEWSNEWDKYHNDLHIVITGYILSVNCLKDSVKISQF